MKHTLLLAIQLICSSVFLSEIRKPQAAVVQCVFDTHADDHVRWSAEGFAKFNSNKTILTLNGNAKLKCVAFSLTADEIVYDRRTGKVSAKNYVHEDLVTKKTTKGSSEAFYIPEPKQK